MPHYTNTALPAFPTDVPTAKLNKLYLSKLIQNDGMESARMFESCKTSGFFLLDLTGCDEGETMLSKVERLFGMAEELYDLALEEKQEYALKPGTAYG